MMQQVAAQVPHHPCCLCYPQVGGEEHEEDDEEDSEAQAAKKAAKKAAQESAQQAAPGATKLNLHTAKRNSVNILVGAGDDGGYGSVQVQLPYLQF